MKKISKALFVLVLLSGCTEKMREEKLYPENFEKIGLKDDSFIKISYMKDSIAINYNLNFSNSEDWKQEQLFVKNGLSYYEIKPLGMAGNFVDTAKVLSLSTRDTTFIYKEDLDTIYKLTTDKGLPPPPHFSLDNWKYKIAKEQDNYYYVKKISLTDSLLSETIYYNERFHVFKIQLNWHKKIMSFIIK